MQTVLNILSRNFECIIDMSQPTEVFSCKLGNSEARCTAPGCICIQYGSNENECDCRCIRDIYKITPDNSREVSEIDEFIDKARENIDTAIFTIKMAEMPLSEVADFLQMFVSEIEVPETEGAGDNIYIVWPTNSTGNDEVNFRASTDGGTTFADKINLSNTTDADSQDVEIAADGDNVIVTWWERNQTAEEPIIRTSTDNGETFRPVLKLAPNGTVGTAAAE